MVDQMENMINSRKRELKESIAVITTDLKLIISM